MPLPSGARLGPYEIVSSLGAGGMGEVYRARDPRIGREVAIKVIAPDTEASPERVHRFEDEARAAGALNHPNVLSVFDLGVDRGAPYVVFELLEGETLRQRLASGSLAVRKVVECATQIARGLAAAHEKGIVHRDLKPENVFLTKAGHVKILDFGLAKLRERERLTGVDSEAPTVSQRTDPGTVLGTVGYMSPEQVRGQATDPRSDIFSFGAILYEMLSGRRAFRGDSSVETLNAILREEPPDLSPTNADIPPALERILRRCLEKDPDQRFRSAHDLAFALDAVSGLTGSGPQSTAPMPVVRRTAWPWLVAGAAAVVATVTVVVGLRLRAGRASDLSPHPSVRVEKLTSRGNVGNPAISPDGRYLVYSSWEDDRLTIWLRDIAEKTETRLVEPFSCWSFEDFRFARDGRAVYYSFQPEAGQASALYKVPLIGGDRRLIHAGVGSVAQLSPDEKRLALTAEKGGNDILSVADVESDQETEIGEIYRDASWSPDGSELLFFRQEEGKYGLFVVRPDGTAERRLGEFAQRPAGQAWRPHGEGVVFGLYSEEYEATRLYDLDLATGVTKPLGDRDFRQGYFSWLPDGSALVLNERPDRGRNVLYVVSYPGGAFERVPADTHDYSGLGLSADGSKLVSVQSTKRSDIVVSTDPEKGLFKKVVSGTDVEYRPCWTPDGKLVYSSNDGGSYDLYVSEADGSNRRQLTFDRASNEVQPAASPDGRHIVFVSDRSGEQGIYRINRDGTDLRSLTPKPTPHYRDYSPQVTPDSRWVLYNHWFYGPSVWRVSIDGGTPVLVKGAVPKELGPGGDWAFGASASPDGRSLAFLYCSQDEKTKEFSGMYLAVASPDGRIVRRFSLSQPGMMTGDDWRVQWSRDGSALYYQGIHEPNLWKQPLAGGPSVQVTRFEESVGYFDWSFDGERLAVSRSSTLSDVVLITNFH